MRLAYNWNRITAVYQSNGESTPKTTSFSAAEEMPSTFVEFFSFFSIEKPNIYHWMWWLSCTSDYRENCTICCRVKRTKKKKKTKIIKWSSHVTLIRRYEAKTNRNESESFFFSFLRKTIFVHQIRKTRATVHNFHLNVCGEHNMKSKWIKKIVKRDANHHHWSTPKYSVALCVWHSSACLCVKLLFVRRVSLL